MLPYVTILDHTLSVYSLLSVLGFLAGLLFILLRSPSFGLSRDDGVYLYVFSFFGVLPGAKLLSLLSRLPELMAHLPMVWSGQGMEFFRSYLASGMVYYGGLFGGLVGAWLAARYFRLRLSDFAPVLVPAIPLFHVFGRLGCFCAGCCYGVEAAAPWGIAFSHAIAAPNGVPLLPVQLWESGVELLLFLFLLWYARRAPDRRYLLPAYLLAYAPARFVLECFRGDQVRGVYGPLSTSQWISLGVAAAVLIWLAAQRRKKRALT